MKFSKQALGAWLAAFLPGPLLAARREWLRASVGMGLGLLVTSLLGCALFGPQIALAVFAPLAASAVLVFAVSSGPLAQPWSVLGSYGLAALVGASVLHWGGTSAAYACLAAGLSLFLMYPLRCVHPPGGAVGFAVVLAAPVTNALGWYVVVPVLSLSATLVMFGLLYNNLSGVRYPRPKALTLNKTQDPLPQERVGVADEDLDRALADFGEFVDITHEDLKEIIRRTEQSALRRHVGTIQARHLMSQDLRWARPDSSLEQAWRLFSKHRLWVLPVVDDGHRVLGMVSLPDLMRAGRGRRPRLFAKWRARSPLTLKQLMSTSVQTVSADSHLVELIQLLSAEGLHAVPVLEQGRLVGMISQTDVIAALQRHLIEQIATSR